MGAARQRQWRKGGRCGCGQRHVCGTQARDGSGGGVEAADLGKDTVDAAVVAGEEHRQALALLLVLASAGPHHLALLALHEPVSCAFVLKRPARSRVEQLFAHRVATM